VVITNQSGIARGLFDLGALEAMHAKMRTLLAELNGQIEAIYFCPHGPDSNCDCRKPKPGLFLNFARDIGRDLAQIYAVGDSYRDIEAALAAGAQPLLVKTGKGCTTLQNHPQLTVPIFENLYEAATYIASQG
jgi:D-glycero-D-manno-heptose 1,7-bisphosphate phosphatase